MTKKRLILICGGILAAALLAVGGIFGYIWISDIRSAQREKHMTAAAKQNAVTLIEEKYGFSPKVLDAELERDGMLFESEYTDKATVLLKEGEREFSAWVDCNGRTDADCDDYQLYEIRDAIAAEIGKSIPGGRTLSLTFTNNGGGVRMFSKKYDGSNLREVLSETDWIELNVGYVNTDFSGYPDADPAGSLRTDSQRMDITLVSFDSEAHRQQLIESDRVFYLWNYAPVITGYAFARGNGLEVHTPDVQNHGDFYTMFDLVRGQTGNAFSVSETDTAALMRDLQAAMPERNVTDPITKAYQITGGTESYYVYYPAEKLEKMGGMLQAAEAGLVYTDPHGDVITTTKNVAIYGDYAVFDITCSDLRFAFLKKAQ